MEYWSQEAGISDPEAGNIEFTKIYEGKTVIALCKEEAAARLIIAALKIHEQLAQKNDTVDRLREAVRTLTEELAGTRQKLENTKTSLALESTLEKMFDPEII